MFVCPECLSELADLSDSLQCENCQKQFPVLRGLPVFSRDRDFYYGELSKDRMQQVLARASLVGWKAALLEYAQDTTDTYPLEYATSCTRTGAKFLLDSFETGTVLDYGCGPGALTASLARNFAKVYATDLTPERAKFTQIRAKQEGLHNVMVFCSGDASHIPLEDNSVNVIVLNGVLEWVPDHSSGDPRAVQIAFLRELRRVLVPDGLLFIGIENRIGFGYLLGKLEEHARLRYVSLLPRMVANLYSQLFRGRPYRNYTYTRSGYHSLLALSGYPNTDFWGFIPDYREPQKLIHISDKSMIRESIASDSIVKRIRNLVIRALFPWMTDAFAILAGEKHFSSYLYRLIEHISAEHLNGKQLRIEEYSVTPYEMVHVRVSSGETGYIIELPLTNEADQRTRAVMQNPQNIEASAVNRHSRYPKVRPIAQANYLGQTYLLDAVVRADSCDS